MVNYVFWPSKNASNSFIEAFANFILQSLCKHLIYSCPLNFTTSVVRLLDCMQTIMVQWVWPSSFLVIFMLISNLVPLLLLVLWLSTLGCLLLILLRMAALAVFTIILRHLLCGSRWNTIYSSISNGSYHQTVQASNI